MGVGGGGRGWGTRGLQIALFFGGCLFGTQEQPVSNSSLFRSRYSVSVGDIYWSNAFVAFEIFLVKLLPTLVKLLNSFGILTWPKQNDLFVNNTFGKDSGLILVFVVTIKLTGQ